MAADTLDSQIRSLIAELIESAPPPPALAELDWNAHGRATVEREVRRRPVLVGGLIGVIAVVLAIAVVLTVVRVHASAPQAASESAPTLGNGQWLYSEQHVSLALRRRMVGHTLTPDAQATVAATVKVWANNVDQVCYSIDARPAQFASPVNRQAWKAAGMLDLPAPNPQTGCLNGGIGATGSQGTIVIDVSKLPTDPVTLANELWTGTTGISTLDGQASAFDRAEILLVGLPVIGASSAFHEALYHALGLIPGIVRLGEMTTHAGSTGVGFAVNRPNLARRVLIVDTKTGTALEAQNIPDLGDLSLNGLGVMTYVDRNSAIGQEGGGGGTIIQWLDPDGTPSVVGSRTLPSGVTVPPVLVYTANLVANAKPNVSEPQIEAEMQHACGGPCNDAQDVGRFTIMYTGPTSEATRDAKNLRASGLFSSVMVTYAGSASGSGTPSTGRSPAPAGLIATITSIAPAVFSQVGRGVVTTPMNRLPGPLLSATNGRVRIVWLGAEYCPYCAAERWPLVIALAQFGTFTNLHVTSSAATTPGGAQEVYPNTATFSFYGSTYASKYIQFEPVEQQDDNYQPLQSPTREQRSLQSTYDASGAIPFIDFANRYMISGSTYDPQILQHQTLIQIATSISKPNTAISQGVIGSANTITAAICKLTNNQPTNTCTNPAVKTIENKL